MRYFVPLWYTPLTQKSMQVPRQMLEPVHLGCHIISLGSKKLPQPVQETLGIRRLQIFNLRPRSSVDQHFMFRGPAPCVVSTASLRPEGTAHGTSARLKRALFTETQEGTFHGTSARSQRVEAHYLCDDEELDIASLCYSHVLDASRCDS
jgi:hypothetical protein